MAEQIVIAENFTEASLKLYMVSERLRSVILRRAMSTMLRVYRKGIQDRIVRRGLFLTGSLFRSVKTSAKTTGAQGLRGAVRIGSRVRGGGDRGVRRVDRGAFYAHMLEGGTKPHDIVPGRIDIRQGDYAWRRSKALFIQGYYRGKVKHPGVRAYRMVADTFEQDTAEATRAFDAYVDAAVASIIEQRSARQGV